MLEGDATVKRFFKEKERVRLQPENDSLEPIYARDVDILGRVVGVQEGGVTAAVLDRPGSLFGDAPGADSAGSAGRLSRGGVTLEKRLSSVLHEALHERQRRVPRVSRAYDIHARGRGGSCGSRLS